MTYNSFFYHTIKSPVGPLTLVVTTSGILSQINFGDGVVHKNPKSTYEKNKYACGAVDLQLEEYFSGRRQEFSLEFQVEGTHFQKEVWYRLGKITYGETTSYSALAKKIGNRNASRAVANAVATNPLPIVIPCHRVIRSDGSLGWYAKRSVDPELGKSFKKTLIDFEKTGPR